MGTKNIIKEYDLNCSEKEFENYYNGLQIDTSDFDSLYPKVNTFDEEYNGEKIDNPANGKYYYTIEIAGRVFLQNIVPYVGGLKALNDDNIDEVIKKHKDNLIQDYVNRKKLQKTIEFFKKE